MKTSGRPQLVHQSRERNRVVDFAELPAAPEIERFILGGILSAPEPNETFEKVAQLLTEADFSIERHRRVFTIFRRVVARGLRLCMEAFAEELKIKPGLLESISPLSDFLEFPQIVNLETYCRIVRELSDKRKLIVGCADLQQQAAYGDLAEAISNGQRLFSEFSAEASVATIEKIGSVFDEVENAKITWVVENLLADASVNGLTGGAGTGKTTLMQHVASSVSQGRSVFGRECSQRSVLFLDRENSSATTCERLNRLHVRDDGKSFIIWGGWKKDPVPEPGDPCIYSWASQLISRGERAPMIVIDSLVAFLGGGDENDSATMRAFMQQLRRLADIGCCVVVLHHVGKTETSKTFRGSSDFVAAVDCGFTLTNLGEGRLDRLKLTPFKSRFETDANLILIYRDGRFCCDDRINAVAKTVTERLSRILHQNPNITSGEFEKLADEQQLGRNRSRQFLEDGVQTGDICRTQGPKNSKLYFLIEHSEALY